MRRFNLIDEPWIPVRFPDGRYEELGIQETLLRANKISTIEDPSPLVVAALHRFLLAVLYRALEGPTDIQQAKELFSNGLPIKKISVYLEKWRDRFWLFDEKYPFYQIPDYEPLEKKGKKEWKSWPIIATEHNASNAKVLFDHIEIAAAGVIPSRKAVRWLLAIQTFALGGGNSDFVYMKSAPSASAIMALPIGQSLQDTLIFCLVPENKDVLAEDKPVWEQGTLTAASLKGGGSRPVLGVADLYTWVSRSIKFSVDENCDKTTVGDLLFASGVGCATECLIDPMLSYRIDEKQGMVPIPFHGRGVWRDFDSLLPDGAHLAPQVIEHAILLARLQRSRSPNSIIVLGQANSKAKVNYWRMERFTLPAPLLDDNFVKNEIRQLLEIAEHAADAMERSLENVGKWSIAKRDRSLKKDQWKAGKWIPGDTSKFIGKSAFDMTPTALAGYWSSLELSFHKVLSNFTQDYDPDEVRCRWLEFVRNALASAWEEYRSSIPMNDAWALRALVKAEPPVLNKLKELNIELRQLQTGEESA